MYETNKDNLLDITNKYSNIKIDTILELGSRDGLDAVSLSKCYPESKIISFECNPETYHLVKNNTNKYSNIQSYELAVTDYDGVIDFYQSTHGNPGSSSIYEKSGEYDYIENLKQKKIQVESIRLKTFLPKIGINKVDLVWADLQGSELKAFFGMEDYLDNVNFIYTEVEYKSIYKNQPLYNDILNFLSSKGFIEQHKTFTCNNFWGDAIFINKKLLSI